MINVHSEIMPLKRVLLHKPGKKARNQIEGLCKKNDIDIGSRSKLL